MVAATRSARSVANTILSISLSIAGFLMPAVLREPFLSAAAEPQKSRCSLPGDSDCAKVVDDDVVVVRVLAALVLRAVDHAHAGLDAEPLQVLHVGQHDLLEVGRVEQELGGQRLARVIAQHILGLG